MLFLMRMNKLFREVNFGLSFSKVQRLFSSYLRLIKCKELLPGFGPAIFIFALLITITEATYLDSSISYTLFTSCTFSSKFNG